MASSSASRSRARSSRGPTVVFADEPTGNLDSTTSGEILELLRSSVDDYGQTIVMVTHDARAAAMADRVLLPRRRPDRRASCRGREPHEILQAIEELNAQ